MNSVVVREPKTQEEWDAYYLIRYEVLRKPWNQPRQSTKDEFETISYHAILILDDKEIVGTGRLQFNTPTEFAIRSMAVKEGYRSKDYGSHIIKHLESIALSKNCKRITLDAREPALKFYERNGYRIFAPSYLLFGVIPHFKMEKVLSTSTD
ncbi:MAG: GNAT family N-acetyltransferase [Bacteroidetes bacterium]|nr:GNAT family N-acetyltransferase [Bacteroidota bacterium]